MPDLMVQIDGQTVPLKDCGWFQRESCGCIVSALVAVVEGAYVCATADQAHTHLFPNRRSREKNDREGLTWELMTMAHYREHIGAKWECAAHIKGATQQATLDAAIGGGA